VIQEEVSRCSWRSVLDACQLHDIIRSVHSVLFSPGLSPASGFEHPASTLPTRFPAALGIGHDLPAA